MMLYIRSDFDEKSRYGGIFSSENHIASFWNMWYYMINGIVRYGKMEKKMMGEIKQ